MRQDRYRAESAWRGPQYFHGCFAPRNNPKIAVSVYVENGRWGGIAAAPIASLLTELYLTDTVTRPQLVEYVKNLQINYPYYGK